MDQPEAVMLNKAAYKDCSKGHTETDSSLTEKNIIYTAVMYR